MKRVVRVAFISTFLIFFFAFMLKWFVNGINFTWVTSNEIQLFVNTVENPVKDLILQIKAIGVSDGFLDTVFNIIKTIGLATILPFRISGVFLVWLFS